MTSEETYVVAGACLMLTFAIAVIGLVVAVLSYQVQRKGGCNANVSRAFPALETLIANGVANARSVPSDINEHIDTLSSYARQCTSICEFGVRSGVSTWGFAHGLLLNAQDGMHVSLRGCDLDSAPEPYVKLMEAMAPGFQVSFHTGNDLTLAPVECDLLFIDTLHVYGQLKRELAVHADGVRKFILLHDTTVDEWKGEVIRNGWNAHELAGTTGIPAQELQLGLWPAVSEFLDDHPEWAIAARFKNNNGLTVLSRQV